MPLSAAQWSKPLVTYGPQWLLGLAGRCIAATGLKFPDEACVVS